MKYDSPNRNRFGSVALTARLEGFIPWFLAPRPEEDSPRPKPTTIEASLSLLSESTVYISKRRVIVHGLERSGTGFCAEIIRRNMRHTDVTEQFKHTHFDENRLASQCRPDFTTPYCVGNSLTKYIIVSRNPYSWILSYEKYYIERASNPTLSSPLTHSHCEHRDRKCWIKTWNDVYNEWLEDIPKFYDHTIVRYEDLLEYPQETLTLLCSRLNLEMLPEFTEVNEYLNNYSNHATPEGKFSRKDYYLGREYMHSLTSEDRAIINEVVDKQLMRKLGYTLET